MSEKAPRFDEKLIKAALTRGNLDAIRKLTRSVESAVWSRRRCVDPAAVTAHGHISDSLASNFLYRLVRACHEFDHVPPQELVDLTRTVLDQDRQPRGRGRRRRRDWIRRAEELLAGDPTASAADIARKVKVHRSTVTRALNDGRLVRPVVAHKDAH